MQRLAWWRAEGNAIGDAYLDGVGARLDALAAENGLSPPASPARPLDATAFNPSKRIGADGRARWPSTESVAKVLAATGTGLRNSPPSSPAWRSAARRSRRWAAHPADRPRPGRRRAASSTMAAIPSAAAGTRSALPEVGDPNAYALEISGDSMEPVFRDGDIVIVSPGAPVRRGDRVVVAHPEGGGDGEGADAPIGPAGGARSLNPAHPDYSFDLAELTWMHRIVWGSQ